MKMKIKNKKKVREIKHICTDFLPSFSSKIFHCHFSTKEGGKATKTNVVTVGKITEKKYYLAEREINEDYFKKTEHDD